MQPSSFSATMDDRRSPRLGASRIPPLSATQQFPSATAHASYSSNSLLSSTAALLPAVSAPAGFMSSIPPIGNSQSLTPLSAGLSPAQASPRRIPPLINPAQQSDGLQAGMFAANTAVSPRSGRLAPLSPSPFTSTLSAQRPSATQPGSLSPFATAQQSQFVPQLQATLPMSHSHFPFPAPLLSSTPLTPQPHPYASNQPLTPLQGASTLPLAALPANSFATTLPPHQPIALSSQSAFSATFNALPQPATTLRPLPDIASLLASCSLQQYIPSFYQTGYTDMASLLNMPGERWQLVLDAVTKDMLVRLGRGEVTDEQLQFGHRQLIVAALQREKDFFFSAASRPATAPQSYLLPPSQIAYSASASTPLSSAPAPTGAAVPINGEDAAANKPAETTASPSSLPSQHHGHLSTIVRHWCCSFIIGAVFLLFSGALFLLWQELQVAPAASATDTAPQHAVTGFNFLKALCVIGFVVGGLCVLTAMRLFYVHPEHRRCGEWCGECCVPSEDGCCPHSECCVKWRNWCTVCCANLPCDTCCASCRSCCAADPNTPGCCDSLCKTDPNAVSCCDKLGDAWTCLWKSVLAAVVAVWSFVCCTTPSASCCAAPELSSCCSLTSCCGKASAPFSCRQCMHDWGCGGLCCDEDGTDECCVPCRSVCDHSECCSGGCLHGCQQSTCYKIVCCQCKISVV